MWLLMRLIMSLHLSGLRISRGSDARVRELAAGPHGDRRPLPAKLRSRLRSGQQYAGAVAQPQAKHRSPDLHLTGPAREQLK